jgi:mannitol/fructose-specific phosphotransferase system IIA component (Ntr-type)
VLGKRKSTSSPSNDQKMFDRLTEIMEDVENVHNALKQCANPEEMVKLQKEED